MDLLNKMPLYDPGENPVVTLLRDGLNPGDRNGYGSRISVSETAEIRRVLAERSREGLPSLAEWETILLVVAQGRSQFTTDADYQYFKRLSQAFSVGNPVFGSAQPLRKTIPLVEETHSPARPRLSIVKNVPKSVRPTLPERFFSGPGRLFGIFSAAVAAGISTKIFAENWVETRSTALDVANEAMVQRHRLTEISKEFFPETDLILLSQEVSRRYGWSISHSQWVLQEWIRLEPSVEANPLADPYRRFLEKPLEVTGRQRPLSEDMAKMAASSRASAKSDPDTSETKKPGRKKKEQPVLRTARDLEVEFRTLSGKPLAPLPEEAERIYFGADFVPLRASRDRPSLFTQINMPFYEIGARLLGSNFKTAVSDNPLAAHADAREFVKFMRKRDRKSPVVVIEWGIGNGRYAFDFLFKIKELDKALYERMTYYAVDASQKMLDDFADRIKNFPMRKKFKFVRCNPDSPVPREIQKLKNVQLIRFNELYDDMPATQVVARDGTFYELYVRPFLHPIHHEPRIFEWPISELLQAAKKPASVFKPKSPFGQHLYFETQFGEIDPDPFPFFDLLQRHTVQGTTTFSFSYAAYAHLAKCLAILKQSGGYMRFNDYGGGDSLPKALAAYGRHRHLTAAPNWEHLRAVGENAGFSVEIETHDRHVSRQHKKPYYDVLVFQEPALEKKLIEMGRAKGVDSKDLTATEDILGDMIHTYWFNREWITEEELLLTPTEDFLREERVNGRKDTPLQRDEALIQFHTKSPDDDDDFMHGSYQERMLMQMRGGGDVSQEERRYAGRVFVRMMHAILGEQWRVELKKMLPKMDSGGRYATAKLSSK